MRNLLWLVGFCCGVSLSALGAPKRHILLLENLPQLKPLIKPGQVLYSKGGVSVLHVEMAEAERWSQHVHHKLGGCGGYVDVSRLVSQGKTPKDIVERELARRQQPVPRFGFRLNPRQSVASLVDKGDATRYWAYLTQLTGFSDRSATTDLGVKAAHWIRAQAEAIGKDIPGFRTVLIDTDRYYPQPSVLAVIPGTERNLGEGGVVLGAHMDTYSDNKPGADDDGSGSAAVLEALTAVARSGAKFKRPLYFLWYAAEERGLVGSGRVVQYFGASKTPVRAAMQLDMVGWDSDADKEDIYLVTDYTNQELTKVTAQLITQYVDAKVGYTRCGYACSDHAHWHRAGVPVVFPFEATFNNSNHRIHTGKDTMDVLKVNYAFRFVKTALAFLGEMAELKGFQP